MLGIALGVAALIIVLSVMNGFQKEVRDRMLGVISHIEVFEPRGAALPDWRATAGQGARATRRWSAPRPSSPRRRCWRAATTCAARCVRGIVAGRRSHASPTWPRSCATPRWPSWSRGSWSIVLGAELARQLGRARGDKVTLVAPGGQVTPAGVVPRLKQFTSVGTFEAGHYEYDSGLALIHLDDAAKHLPPRGPDRRAAASCADLHQARRSRGRAVGAAWARDVIVRDWTRTNRNWFDAVQIEKRLMFIILTLIVAVAAFNLVSTLVMTVTDKRADIAILRTLGASPRSVMGIFMVQGAAAGVIGTLAGVVLRACWSPSTSTSSCRPSSARSASASCRAAST